ncbi:MAG: type III PLP-dependent enzyme [Alphaproteobacteria bacterium]|nr:type III PLP-dependent enzyme [Alphaproteobacteria bacterium]
MTTKIERFLAERRPATPCLVVDLDVVAEAYRELKRLLPEAKVFYAVKANPEPAVVDRLLRQGCGFDTASLGEVDLCLARGARATHLSFGNTIKKERDIALAYARGVRLFAFDSEAELDKLARAAPGAQVFCRILVDCQGAEWPLSRKFGCAPEMAVSLLRRANELGLDSYGISFHVGSQQTDPRQWDPAVKQAARMFSVLAEVGVNLRMLNVGGGFPARYVSEVPELANYVTALRASLIRHFGNALPELVVEPGRSLVADAGVIESEVVLISRKDDKDARRWVYLDVGKFNGLAETMDESIKYRLRLTGEAADRRGGGGPVVLAGPTCDSADILYEKTSYTLPLSLRIGDKVQILSAGAYTASYASVGFNGFAPIQTYCI